MDEDLCSSHPKGGGSSTLIPKLEELQVHRSLIKCPWLRFDEENVSIPIKFLQIPPALPGLRKTREFQSFILDKDYYYFSNKSSF